MMKLKPQQLRIIAGKWRSKKLSFTALPGVRPTPNRVRETLFNWLAPKIQGAKCLDCFSGSGALGFEALSRGASWVTMIDKSPRVISKLKENAALLGAANIDFICASFPLANKIPTRFDIVFLDPPYHKNLIAPSCFWLEENDCLQNEALIYIESEQNLSPLPVPNRWQIIKSQKAGQVRYYLVRLIENKNAMDVIAPSKPRSHNQGNSLAGSKS